MYQFDAIGYEQACDLTRSILQKAGITAPPVPIRELCRLHGLEVVEKNIAPRKAMLSKRKKIIFVQPGETPEQRVRIAHELGHWILPEHFPEMSHDLFAWCLLSPHDWLVDFSSPLAPQVISEDHHLPVSVAKKRLRLFDQWHRANTHLTTLKDDIQHGTDPSQSRGAP